MLAMQPAWLCLAILVLFVVVEAANAAEHTPHTVCQRNSIQQQCSQQLLYMLSCGGKAVLKLGGSSWVAACWLQHTMVLCR
jgi:hypothetical protein